MAPRYQFTEIPNTPEGLEFVRLLRLYARTNRYDTKRREYSWADLTIECWRTAPGLESIFCHDYPVSRCFRREHPGRVKIFCVSTPNNIAILKFTNKSELIEYI